MKNIKDITISIFAVIGFVAIITAFTNQPEQVNQPEQANQTTTPESHVWEVKIMQPSEKDGKAYMWNKVTGEIRKLTLDDVRPQNIGVKFDELPIKYIKLESAN